MLVVGQFTKGIARRWMEVFTASQRKLAQERFGDPS